VSPLQTLQTACVQILLTIAFSISPYFCIYGGHHGFLIAQRYWPIYG